MQSARWVTPAEGATIVCAGLGVRSMEVLTFPAAEGAAAGKVSSCLSVPNLECDFWPWLSGMCQGSSVRSIVHLAGQTWQSASIQHLVGVGEPHMLVFGQTWQLASAAVQCAVGTGQPHILAFGQPSASSGFPLSASEWQPH